MRLQLSLRCEDLPNPSLTSKPDPFAVVTLLQVDNNGSENTTTTNKPLLLGQTEVLPNTKDPDWTRLFLLDQFELGHTMTLAISIYSDRRTNVGTVLIEVGSVLGAPGSTAARSLRKGGILVLHVEPATENGTFNFRLRGWELTNQRGAGILQTSDPFFELQRLRKSAAGKTVWDTVFRSSPCKNDLHPQWPEGCVEVSALCGPVTSSTDQQHRAKVRLAIYDYYSSGKHMEMGTAIVTLAQLLELVNPNALGDHRKMQAIDLSKAITITKSGKDTGKIFVAEATITGVPPTTPQPEEPLQPPPAPIVEEEEEITVEAEDIVVAAETDELVDESPTGNVRPTFVDYVAGGCQLRVVVAIDATASNGDPRQESSLHYFKTDGSNSYEECLFALCSILSKYDSDQKYPVWGFGAKQDGEIQHCFNMLPSSSTDSSHEEEVEGVEGILQAYRDTFRSGLVMSSPRDFTEIIDRAAKDGLAKLQERQSYSILLIFTNGGPSDIPRTVEALRAADEAPLSVVIVGVGEGDFSGIDHIQSGHKGARDKLRFVHFQQLQSNPTKLSEVALDCIPDQLVTYFVSHNITPDPVESVEEIMVEPYDESTDIEIPLEIAESGEAIVTGEISDEEAKKWQAMVKDSGKKIAQGSKKVIQQNKKLVGRLARKTRTKISKIF